MRLSIKAQTGLVFLLSTFTTFVNYRTKNILKPFSYFLEFML